MGAISLVDLWQHRHHIDVQSRPNDGKDLCEEVQQEIGLASSTPRYARAQGLLHWMWVQVSMLRLLTMIVQGSVQVSAITAPVWAVIDFLA